MNKILTKIDTTLVSINQDNLLSKKTAAFISVLLLWVLFAKDILELHIEF